MGPDRTITPAVSRSVPGRKADFPDVPAYEESYTWFCRLRATYPYLLGGGNSREAF